MLATMSDDNTVVGRKNWLWAMKTFSAGFFQNERGPNTVFFPVSNKTSEQKKRTELYAPVLITQCCIILSHYINTVLCKCLRKFRNYLKSRRKQK